MSSNTDNSSSRTTSLDSGSSGSNRPGESNSATSGTTARGSNSSIRSPGSARLAHANMVRPTQQPATPNPLATATEATWQQSPESSGIPISAAPVFALPVQEGEDPDVNLPQAPALLFRELFDETVMKGATASDDGHIAAAAKEQQLISATLERVWNLQEGKGPGDTLPQSNQGGKSEL